MSKVHLRIIYALTEATEAHLLQLFLKALLPTREMDWNGLVLIRLIDVLLNDDVKLEYEKDGRANVQDINIRYEKDSVLQKVCCSIKKTFDLFDDNSIEAEEVHDLV